MVLCFWDSLYPPSRKTLPLLEQIYQKYKSNPRVAFLAVSLDDPKTESKSLQELFDKWKVHVPIVRESEPSADPLRFKDCPLVPFLPIFVLGGDGVVQYFDVQYVDERGGQPSFVKDLPAQLDQLLAGKDVYPLALQRYDEQREALSTGAGRRGRRGNRRPRPG